jgi:hypothetical protein
MEEAFGSRNSKESEESWMFCSMSGRTTLARIATVSGELTRSGCRFKHPAWAPTVGVTDASRSVTHTAGKSSRLALHCIHRGMAFVLHRCGLSRRFTCRIAMAIAKCNRARSPRRLTAYAPLMDATVPWKANRMPSQSRLRAPPLAWDNAYRCTGSTVLGDSA